MLVAVAEAALFDRDERGAVAPGLVPAKWLRRAWVNDRPVVSNDMKAVG
jgi:hypothetical protein